MLETESWLYLFTLGGEGVDKAHKKVKFIKLDNKYEKQNYITCIISYYFHWLHK